MARGRVTRDWSETTKRTQNDAFALKMYQNAADQDEKVVKVVKEIAQKHGVPRVHVALAWLLSKPEITAPIIGATKPEHLSTAVEGLTFTLANDEIAALEAPYVPHPVDGIVPPLSDEPPAITPPRS
jgi:1-deoxyxylulose-5-phosphate synthase